VIRRCIATTNDNNEMHHRYKNSLGGIGIDDMSSILDDMSSNFFISPQINIILYGRTHIDPRSADQKEFLKSEEVGCHRVIKETPPPT
jgi:hypothetical protein